MTLDWGRSSASGAYACTSTSSRCCCVGASGAAVCHDDGFFSGGGCVARAVRRPIGDVGFVALRHRAEVRPQPVVVASGSRGAGRQLGLLQLSGAGTGTEQCVDMSVEFLEGTSLSNASPNAREWVMEENSSPFKRPSLSS